MCFEFGFVVGSQPMQTLVCVLQMTCVLQVTCVLQMTWVNLAALLPHIKTRACTFILTHSVSLSLYLSLHTHTHTHMHAYKLTSKARRRRSTPGHTRRRAPHTRRRCTPRHTRRRAPHTRRRPTHTRRRPPHTRRRTPHAGRRAPGALHCSHKEWRERVAVHAIQLVRLKQGVNFDRGTHRQFSLTS